jgi:hypothetical protein
MAALGTGAGAGEARTRAEQEGATAEQRGTATALGSVVGVSEMFAPVRILGRVSEPIKAGATAQLKRIAAAGGEEAAQEAAAQIAQNLIAKGVYKPEQAIIEQVGESAAYGGAVGALAQGLLDMALGRRVSKAGTPDEIAQARAEADAAKAAEEERKADPAYAQKFVADYEARRDAFVQANAALKKPGKGATPDIWQAYKEQKKELDALKETLEDDAKEYNKLKGVVAQQAARARLEAMSPEDFFLEQAGMQVRPLAAAPTKTIIDEFGQIREVPVDGQEQETLTPAAQYLTQQMQGARNMGVFGLGELADFAMQNPEMARQAVAEQVQLDFLKPAENRALLGGIKLRLKEVEKQRAASMRDEMAQRAADIKAQAPTVEMPDTTAQDLGEFYQQKVEEGQGYIEPTFEYLDPIFEKAFNQPPVVAVKPEVTPVADAPKLRQRVEDLLQQADAVDVGAAKLTNNPQAQAEAEQKLAGLINEINRLGQFGDEYTKEFVRLRGQQNEALAGLQDVLDTLRTGQVLGKETFVDAKGRVQRVKSGKGAAASTEQTLINQVERLRAQFISSSLQEAALHRRAEGKPALTQDEAVKAASKLFDTINTWTERAKTKTPREELTDAQRNLKPLREKVQKRGNTVRTYKLYDPETNGPVELTIIRQPDGSVFRVFSRYPDGGGVEFDNAYAKTLTDKDIVQKSFLDTEMFTLGKQIAPGQQGISPAEIRHFRKRLDAVRRDLFAVPEPKGTRVEGEFLKRQYPAVEAAKVAEQRGETAQTLAGELRRRTEFVRNKMAKMGPMRPAARNALNKAADVLDSGKATRDILDKTEALVDAINNKLQVKQVDVQALEDALRAAQPTAEEQRVAGQKSLFPETQEDLGYIRMSPKNFANSPRIKPVWAALTKARAAAARLKSKQEKRRRIDKARIAAVERLSGEIEKLENRTEFFWKDQTKWTNEEIARSFVEFPDIASTPEDKALVNRYIQTQKLTLQEQFRVDELLRDFREKARPEYDAKLKQALSLLAEQGTLDAVENSLTKFMLDSNKQTREAAKALQERLSPYKRTIDALRQAMKGSPILTPAQKQLAAASDKASQRRNKFAATVKHAMDAARVEIEAALEEVLDPEIARAEQALTKAEKDLAAAKKDLDRYKKKFDEILAVPGRMQDRTQLATYELFRYEEKQGIIQDLEQRIEKEAAQLADLYEARLDSLSGAQVAAQAMLNKNVQYHRKLAVDAEKRLAALKGDEVLDKPGAYPFAASQAEAEIKTANAQVANAEAMKKAFDKQLASMKKQETPLYERMNKLKALGGIKRVEGRVAPIKTAEQVAREKELDDLSREYQQEQEKAQRDAIKQAQIDEAENRVVELTLDAARYDGPMDAEQLVTLLSQEGVSRNLKAQYTLKLDALQKLQIEEARIDALKEGRPAREPKPATVPTTAKQSAAKGFRTGYRKTLEAASEALASEREGRAPGRAQGLLDPDAFVSSDDLGGLFEGKTSARVEDERFARGVEVESPDLTPTQIQALEENDLTAALADIANNKKNTPLNRAVAQRLSVLLDATDVQLDDKLVFDGEEVLGAATSKLVQLSRDGGLSQEVLLHEGTHAAAERVIVQYEKDPSKLTEQQRVAVRELKAIFEAVKKDPRITSANAKSGLSEFVAEVMSNSKLQEQLREKPWRMSDMLRAIKSVILRMVGITPSEVETMLGASITAVDALFIPSSTRLGTTEQRVTRQLSAKDIAALHDGSNSMQQFADQFGPLIKQADRTPQDVERIAMDYIYQMETEPKKYVPLVDSNKLDYTSSTIMSDGKPYDENNPLHYVEATPATFAFLEAQADPGLRSREATEINSQRIKDFRSLIKLLQKNPSYTLAEQALVIKAASQYGVVSDKNGRLKMAVLDNNNRHGIAVVSQEAADAVIRELRAGKSLKKAFLEGLQANADASASVNSRKNGWQKFDQASAKSAAYTEKEIEDALGQTGYDPNTFATETELVEQLVQDGLLPAKPALKLEDAAVALNAGAAGTPWCTGASVGTARLQIEQGDFYIYYKDGKPEVAVRMNGQDEIAEVRGNNPDQALDAEQQKIAATFLANSGFAGADKYLEEFALKQKLVDIAKGDSYFELRDLLRLGRNPLEDDGSVDAKIVKRMFKFRAVDGYSNRPDPSDAVIAFFGQELKDSIFDAYAKKGFIYSEVDVPGKDKKDQTIKVEIGGQTFEATPDTLVAADRLSFATYNGSVFSLPRLIYAKELDLFGRKNDKKLSVDLPSALVVEEIITFTDAPDLTVVTLPKDVVVKELRGYASRPSYIEVRGPKQINTVRVRGYGADGKLLHAQLPDTQYFVLEGSPGRKNTIDAPNFVAERPPVATVVEAPETPRFAPKPQYASPEMEAAGKKLDPFVTKQRSVNERVRAASGGFLGLETRLVDRFAGFERLRKYMPELQGSQMIYYMRMYDQRMNMVSQAVGTGAPVIAEKKRKDGQIERVLEAKEGPSIKRVVDILRDASPMVGNGEAVNRLFTAYMAAIRADNKGFESLNFGKDVTRADLDSALSVVNGNPELKAIFDKARGEYNEYNRNLINFVVETGALSKRTAKRLLAENDYIPFYRERNGVAELLIGNETPIRIGSIKDQPYLQELVGGDQPILDFMTSSVQNTNMLIDMGMRNLATKNAVFELLDLSAAKLVRKAEGPDVVQFKVDGEDRYAVLATEKVKIGNKEFDTGVPADILVKGMEGIPTQMPFIFRALAIPAQILRKGVTLSPIYMANQLFRDSLAAPIAAGANFTPVLGALRQIGKPVGETLERRGITGGQQFTGGAEDISMILRSVADGKPGWMNALAKAEAFAMSADSLTRRAQYNSYIEQGMSEMEATLLALESMNFNKRGYSPSIHIANALIPFFNAQIQGLNVLYKAMTGQMPFNDKLKIRQKLLQRGGMMAAASIVYALMMQDDEAYKNAEPDQKYGKWFVRIPGVDEPVRVPIPFEIGYIFKALPEALVNSMLNEHGDDEAVKAFKNIIIQTIPGGSSMPKIGGYPVPLPLPQAVKPAIEAALGKSFFTGRDILSAREKELLPEEQFRANTAEMSKLIGQVTGTSPIILENLVRGYTGTVGLAFLHALSLGVPPGESPEKAVKRLSEYPIVGGVFQPNDAGGITNSVYERMNDAQKVERTYEKLVEEGRMAEAKELLQRRGNDFLQAELAKEFKANMNQLIAAERAIQASGMSPEEKRAQLDQIRKLKIAVAKQIRDVSDKMVKLSFSL